MSTETTTVSQTAEHTRYLENIDVITRALPGWLTRASVATRQAYSRSLKASHQANRAAKAVLSTLRGLDEFAAKVLTEALLQQFKVRLDVHQARFLHYVEVPLTRVGIGINGGGGWALRSQGSLLQAALQNFIEDECDASEFFLGSGICIGDQRYAAIAPQDFARFCRTLDLGARYQRHLHSVLTPDAGEDGVAGAKSLAVENTLALARRFNLEVAAHVACMKGAISWSAYQMLLQVCEGHSQAIYDSCTTVIKQITLFGHELTGIVVFEQGSVVGPSGKAGFERVVYMPDEPTGELLEYEDAAAFIQALGTRLRFVKFRDYLVKHAPILEQESLKQRLTGSLRAQIQEAGIAGDLFVAQIRQQARRTFEDSRQMAVPTADVDAAQRRERLAELETAGLLLATLASFVVPVLNHIMLAATAVQLMSETYHGIKDWSEGRTDEAMGHLVSVVETLGVGLAIGVIAHRVNLWANQSEFFQSLRAVKLFDGTEKLWSPDLAPYQVTVDLDETAELADGRYQVGEKHYIAIDGQDYQVSLDQRLGKWRLVHPRRNEAYSPVLLSNGEGAWRHALEKPWGWSSARYLFRRLGAIARGLDDEAIDAVLAISGVDEQQLCRLHVDQLPVPARLKVVRGHWQLDRDIDRFIEQLQQNHQVSDQVMARYLWPKLDVTVPAPDADAAAVSAWAQAMAAEASVDRAGLFEHCAALRGPTPSPEAALICRDFPGLPKEMAQEVAEQACDAELARMSTSARIPLAVAERARWHLRDYRLLCALEGFYLPKRRALTFDKLALGLLEHLPAWKAEAVVQVREMGSEARLIAQGGKGRVDSPIRVIREEQGYAIVDDKGAMSREYQDLFAVLSAIHGDASAVDLQRQLTALALADRSRAAALIGQGSSQPWFRMPTRLSENRLGYPMGGEGAVGAHSTYFMEQFKILYPSMTSAEIAQHLDQLQASGMNVRRLLDEKTAELQSLRETLGSWAQQEGPGQGRTARRRQVTDALMAGWRRQSNRLFGDRSELVGYRLSLQGTDLSELPAFPDHIDFGHVHHLSLRGTGLDHIPNGFLDAFSKLRTLDLAENRLTSLPQVIGDMSTLESLHCESNAIVLTETTAGVVGSLRRLEQLNFNDNPLGFVPDLSRLTGLRILEVRNTGINRLPAGLTELNRLEMVDLRDNQFSELSDELYDSTERPVRSLFLQGNPFSADTLNRIREYRQRTGINLGWLAQQMEGEARPDLFWSQDSDQALTQLREQHWFALREEPGSQEFFRLLTGLSATADYDRGREDLARRVWEVVEAAYANSDLREELFLLAGNPRTCGDSVALNFTYLEIQVEVFKARQLGQAARVKQQLLDLAKGLFRLEQLDQIVYNDLRSRPVVAGALVDEVEVSLAYRTGLARELNLPGQARTMLYSSLADVTPARLEAAKTEILQAERRAGAVAEFVCGQDFWSQWLREQHSDDFASLRASMEDEEQALEVRKADLDDQAYLLASDQMHKRYQEKLAALQLRLTEAALTESELPA